MASAATHHPSGMRLTHLPRMFGGVSLVSAAALGCNGTAAVTPGPPFTPLTVEAGFIEVPAGAVAGPNYQAKLFYSFYPAAADAEDAPLMVIFNGGPGAATSGLLMVYGTGPQTLDGDAPVDAAATPNEAPYTRFANLLFVDARMTGFSYGVDGPGDCIQSGTGYVEDAADFVYALLEFLDTHEALRGAPTVLLGESYGGTRAPMMLYELQHYGGPPNPPIADMPDLHERLPWLQDRVQAHFDLEAPSRRGQVRSPEEVAQQFGWQVLMQPNFWGLQQITFQMPLLRADPLFAAFRANPGVFDPYDVRKPFVYEANLTTRAESTLLDPMALAKVLGVEPATIAGLPAADRHDAFRLLDGYDPATLAADEAHLRADLGDVGVGDTYWLPLAPACPDLLGGTETADALLELLPRTHTFITDAVYDTVVYSAAIPKILALTMFDVQVDATLPAGATRPGEIVMTSDAANVTIRFPTYQSGHQVTVGASQELGEDLSAWLLAEGATAPH